MYNVTLRTVKGITGTTEKDECESVECEKDDNRQEIVFHEILTVKPNEQGNCGDEDSYYYPPQRNPFSDFTSKSATSSSEWSYNMLWIVRRTETGRQRRKDPSMPADPRGRAMGSTPLYLGTRSQKTNKAKPFRLILA